MSVSKSWLLKRIFIFGFFILLIVMYLTVPSTQDYQEMLSNKYKIKSDLPNSIHSTSDPMTEHFMKLPFFIIGETYILDNPDNSIKVLGIFDTFIVLNIIQTKKN